MRQIAAAIPLAIALSTTVIDSSSDRQVHFRLAANSTGNLTESALIEKLNERQLKWFKEHNVFGMPVSQQTRNQTLVVREGYTLAHNNVDKISDWVSFRLTEDYVNGTEKRPGSSAFKSEPLVARQHRAELEDYEGWGNTYHRGHQVAAGDTKGRGNDVIRSSFYLSNMTPQSGSLNSGQWRSLEMRIQSWAKKFGEVWVVTGPMFIDDDSDGIVEYFTIGDNAVAVPTHYFKAVLVPHEQNTHDAIAFIIPNKKIKDYKKLIYSIDEIEQHTQLDLFPLLPDEIEAQLEAKVQSRVWPK